MADSSVIIYIIKLFLGGVACFLSIILWAKSRDAAWMALVAAVITEYAQIVYCLMLELGVIVPSGVVIFGLPLLSVLFAVVPFLFLITSISILIYRNSR